jgi:ribosome-associated protein
MDVTYRLMTTENSTIKLDQFLKFAGAAQTGGEAKLMIQEGEVMVNAVTETRRGRKLVMGDRVIVRGETYTVELG